MGESTEKLKKFIESPDPLDDEIIKELISHREEDLYIDYKESFDNSEKQWHGLTADCVAFANTFGGYIIFGIRDVNFKIIGVSDESIQSLINTNLIHQKINRHILPPLTSLRTKRFQTDEGLISVIYIPESKGKTHIIINAASYLLPSGATKQVFYPGMVYIRRSATNHIIDPDDLDFIINKRIDFYKDRILDRITRVVEMPLDRDVLIFDSGKEIHDGQKYIAITADENATPIKGISFSVVPKSFNEEVISWNALFKRDLSFCPSQNRLWAVYFNRRDILKDEEVISSLIQFSLNYEMPIFYWLQFLKRGRILILLKRMVIGIKSFHKRVRILHIAAFLGKNYYMQLLGTFHDEAKRLNRKSLLYQINSPSEWFYPELINGKRLSRKELSESAFRETLENDLDILSELLSKYEKLKPSDEVEAVALDCFLYSKENKYLSI